MEFFEKLVVLLSTPDYWEMILTGLRTTAIVSLGAMVLGLILGTVVAMIGIAPKSKIMFIPKAICSVYITVIRGTPVALQLFIIVFAIFGNFSIAVPDEIKAILAFGINSGAYVAESIRGGILSVDKGQTEAGRALGLSGFQTMIFIVIPQAIKNVIPAIGNELIALIKETSIVSMIGMYDLTVAAKIIGSGNNLASYIVPMSVVALVYLAIVYILTFCIKMIERRLRRSDR